MKTLEVNIQQKKKANKITLAHTAMSTGLGFVPVPLLDAVGILGIQLWMLRRLAEVYDVPFKQNLAKSVIGTLVGNAGSVGMLKLIPGLGSVLGGSMVAVSAGAATYALGKIFTQHFSQGGTLLSFDPVKSQDYFRELYEEGKATVKKLKAQDNGLMEVHNQALASTSALKQANEELKTTIALLQNQLEQTKKDRVAQKKEKRRRHFGWLWLLLFLIIIGVGAAVFYRRGNLSAKIFSNGESKENTDTSGIADQKVNTVQPEKTTEDIPVVVVGIDSMAATEAAPDTSAAILAGPTAAEMNFTAGSTEAVMADYMSAVNAIFPKSFRLGKAQFEEGVVRLTPEAEEQVANIATLLQNYPIATLRIYGQADQKGGEAANRQAGRNRARVIQELLEKNGIERNRISAAYLRKPAPPEDKRGAEIVIEKRN